MRQSVCVKGLTGLPRGFGDMLTNLVSEEIGNANVPEGVSITYGGFEPQTCKMHFDVSGCGGVSHSFLTQVTETVASKVALVRPARSTRGTLSSGRAPHLSLVPRF